MLEKYLEHDLCNDIEGFFSNGTPRFKDTSTKGYKNPYPELNQFNLLY